jgi:hypothetical protein
LSSDPALGTLPTMDHDERAALLQRYADGAAEVRNAVQDLTDAELDAAPANDPDADGWTARQIVHHLADSEMTSAIRLRRLIAEHEPAIAAYDEAEYARRLHYDSRPIDASLDAMEAARRSSLDLLHHLTDEEWQRRGTHTESGPYDVEGWLRIYTDHAHDHADQIRRAAASR